MKCETCHLGLERAASALTIPGKTEFIVNSIVELAETLLPTPTCALKNSACPRFKAGEEAVEIASRGFTGEATT